jgi:hypothetical protein
MIIGIVGSRRRDTLKDYELVKDKFLEIYKYGDTIVSGGCPKGGDRFAEMIASSFNIPIIIHKADWGKGRGAGFVRNTYIAEDSEVLIACVSADRTGGTEDTIKKYLKLKKNRLILV